MYGGNIPDDLKTAYVMPMYKEGKRNHCNKYRGASVISTFSKINGHIIKEILEEAFKDMLSEEHARFRAG
jgi:hypothetical protein